METFRDRTEAGRQLGVRLAGMTLENPVVYALPRGGVPVALEVATALDAPLDLIMVRKIGAPGAPELALAAIVDGESPQMVVNERVRRHTGADDKYIERRRAEELREIERRRVVYLDGHDPIPPEGRTAILVDDGLATGATMKVALEALRQKGALATMVAVPVAPVETLPEFEDLADAVVCLHPAEAFYGVGAFYHDFHQLTDEETRRLLRDAWDAGPKDV